jgi:hypothetical protein
MTCGRLLSPAGPHCADLAVPFLKLAYGGEAKLDGATSKQLSGREHCANRAAGAFAMAS